MDRKTNILEGQSPSENRKCMPVEHIEAYFMYLRQINRSEHTIRIRRQSLERFMKFYKDIAFKDVDLEILEIFQAYLGESGLSENSIDMIMRSLRGLFEFLEDRNIIFNNPFLQIRMHRPRQRKMDILTKSEMKLLLSLPDTQNRKYTLRIRAMLEILYSVGLRRTELSLLKISDIDFDGKSIRVMGKGDKERILPLGKIACKAVKEYLSEGRPELMNPENLNEYLWLDCNGNQMTKPNIMMVIKAAGKRAGIHKTVSCHMIRRTCATHMLLNGAHPMMISQLLGHSQLQTLNHYLNLSMKEIMETHAKTNPGR